jgi:hypothetical protein
VKREREREREREKRKEKKKDYRHYGTTVFVISGCAEWFAHPLHSEIKF